MTEKTITLEATGEFPFTFYIEKAVATETEKELIIEGVASTTNIDHDNERMSKEALDAMVNIINTKGVPLRVEHSKSQNAIIGDVFKGWVDDRQQLHIQARLDKSHPVSPVLHHSMMTLGKKMGFSVGGLVKRAMREFSEAKGKLVKTFYDVELKEVSVTPRPANYDSWAVAKSMAKDEVEAEAMRGTYHDMFLFENPQMDYLQAFAKSVSSPDVVWNRSETRISKNNNNKDMTTETDEKKEKATKEDEDTTKAVSRAEFGVVIKSIETLAKAMEAMATAFGKDGLYTGPKDQNAPAKEKPEDESPAAKSSTEGTDTDGTREKDMGDKPKDQANPGKDKPEDESPAAKATDKKDESDTYDMKTVERSISSLESLTKRLTGVKKDSSEKDETKEKAADSTDETKEKTSDKKEDETETEKGMHPLDVFVGTVTKTIEAMADRLEKHGMNLIGFEKAQVERIVNDPQMQVEIQKMLKIPGAKKSVIMGTPFMIAKSGKRFALTAQEVGVPTIEKSRTTDGKTPSFKDVYKADFSSVREGQE